MLVAKRRPQQLYFSDQQRSGRRLDAKRQKCNLTAAVKLKMLGLVFIFALTAVSLLAHYTYVVGLNHQIIIRNEELRSLQEQGQHLELEMAGLRSPERLEKMALEIGMIYPRRDQMIILSAADTDQ